MATSNSEACTVASPDSDVFLDVPEEAVQEMVVGRVYTNIAKFRHLIPEDECPISPIVEFCPIAIGDTTIADHKGYRIHIPHSFTDVEKVKKQVRVWYGDIHNKKGKLKLITQRDVQLGKMSFEINDKFLTIHTDHLTGFMATLHGSVCYERHLCLKFCGSLSEITGSEACRVKLKSVLCSSLHNIKDFEKVKHLSPFFLF